MLENDDKQRDAAKWYKYLNKALTTKNPNMRKFFHKKAIEYALKVQPDLQIRVAKIKSDDESIKKDRYGSLRDKMMDE